MNRTALVLVIACTGCHPKVMPEDPRHQQPAGVGIPEQLTDLSFKLTRVTPDAATWEVTNTSTTKLAEYTPERVRIADKHGNVYPVVRASGGGIVRPGATEKAGCQWETKLVGDHVTVSPHPGVAIHAQLVPFDPKTLIGCTQEEVIKRLGEPNNRGAVDRPRWAYWKGEPLGGGRYRPNGFALWFQEGRVAKTAPIN